MKYRLISSILYLSSTSSSVVLVVVLLLSSLCVVARDLAQRSDVDAVHNTASLSEEKQWINHMCAAQCDAFCNENTAQCREVCKTNATRSWIIRCRESDLEVESANYETEDVSYLMRSLECPGTCSILKDQEEAGYFIPMTPDVVLVRDLSNHSVTLTWSPPPNTPSPIVYVVQEKEESGPRHLRHWAEAHLVMRGDHFTRSNLGVCSRPMYRVAAVSRYGSHWFSEEVQAPDGVPGPPRMLQVSKIHYDASLMSFVITITWLNPTGWDLRDLKPMKPFSWQNYIKCPPSLYTASAIEDRHSFSNSVNSLTFHIADFAVGCKIIYAVSATSKCDDDLVSDRAYLTMDLSCRSVQDFYSGEYCTPPPFDPPGKVQHVQITVVPGMHGARAHVTWAPPTDLGSAGAIGYYTVYYGLVDEVWGFGFKDNVFHNITVTPDTLHAVVPVLQDSGSDGTFGILVMAGAAGQKIDLPIGDMHVVHASFSDGKVLLDEDIVVYQINKTREVRVYWSPPPPSKREVTGVALQWGPLSKLKLDVKGHENDVGKVTYNVTGLDVELPVQNTTVVDETREKRPRD